MNLFTIILTIIGGYFIYKWVYKHWNDAELEEVIDSKENVDEQHKRVVKFNSEHKNIDQKKEKVDKFLNN